MIISPPQAWSMLRRHADTDVKSLRLSELRNHENEEEVGSFVTVHNPTPLDNDDDNDGHLLILDWSRQRMTMETIHHLLRLSTARQIRDRIRDLAWGRLAPGASSSSSSPSSMQSRRQRQRRDHPSNRDHDNGSLLSPTVSFACDLRDHEKNNSHDNRKYESGECDDGEGGGGGSMHLAYRAPANKGLTMRDPYCTARSQIQSGNGRSNKSINALDVIHNGWKEIQSLTDSIRRGSLRGATGRPLVDVVVVSASGMVVPHALEFVHRALMDNEEAEMASFVDPSSLLSATKAAARYNAAATAAAGRGGSGGTVPQQQQQPPSSSMSKSSGESMASGVINMVTTPFKSARSIKNLNNPDLLHGTSPLSYKSNPSSSFRKRKLRVLTSIDPSEIKESLSGLSPTTTMIVTLSLDSEREKECNEINLAVREWLLSAGMMDNVPVSGSGEGSKYGGSNNSNKLSAVLRKHMFLVTGNELSKKSNPNAFLLPRHSRCEAFTTFSAAGLLPLSFVFGWNIASSFLAGAHDIDRHFVDTNPRHNLPIILSLVDLWNDAFLHSNGRVVSPYSRTFGSYPGLVATMENRVLNGSVNGDLIPSKSGSLGGKDGPSPVIDGGSHSPYRSCIGRESNELSVEFIMSFDPPSSDPGISTEDILANHDSRMCSLFAHADTLAFGGSNGNNNRGRFEVSSPGSPPMIQSVDSMLSHGSANGGGWVDAAGIASGNQPSTLIVCGTCDAFTCGQLIALAEHRAMVKAWLWDVDPFATATTTTTTKSSIEEERHDYLSDKLYQMHHLLSMGENLDEADESLFPEHNGGTSNETGFTGFGGGVHSATKTVLKHYATRMQRHHRNQTTPRTPLRFRQNGPY